MKNEPAFCFSAPVLGLTSLVFLANGDTEFRKPAEHWGRLCDQVDARLGGGVLSAEYDDSAWETAKPISWVSTHNCIRGKLAPRSLAMLRRTPVCATYPQLPHSGSDFIIKTQKDVITFVTFTFTAEAGSCIEIDGNCYISDGQKRTYRTANPVTTHDREIHIRSDAAFTLYDLRLETETYPWEIAGDFVCDDAALTEFWQQCAYTLLQTSTDGYISDGEERCEWTADSLMVEYPMSMVSVVSEDGKYSDPALLRKTIFDIAQSQGDNGMLKAHHPSDRFDIHACIEDYCCIWVEALLAYYEGTLDLAFAEKMKPVLLGQLDALCRLIGEDGLVLAREFIIFDNPLKYRVCRGTTINCFVYAALLHGAKLLSLCGDIRSAYYSKRANALRTAINRMLYDAEHRTYYASAEDRETVSYHGPLIALYCGLPGEEDRKSVLDYVHEHAEDIGRSLWPYTERYLFLALYERDTLEDDRLALHIMKTAYAENFAENNPGYVTYERFGEGSRPFHCFGMVPGYFLSAYVLGVRPLGAIDQGKILVEPHLGELRNASGAVVTAFGVVRVSWEKEDDGISFSLEIPCGATILLRLPAEDRKVNSLTINGQNGPFVVNGNRIETVLNAGCYSGECAYEHIEGI